MRRYRFTTKASEDLIAIYIQGHDAFGPRQADLYQDELKDLFERLAEFPGLARLRPEVKPPVRVFTHKAHAIVYEADDQGVTILRVRHAHEDWMASAF